MERSFLQQLRPVQLWSLGAGIRCGRTMAGGPWGQQQLEGWEKNRLDPRGQPLLTKPPRHDRSKSWLGMCRGMGVGWPKTSPKVNGEHDRITVIKLIVAKKKQLL